MSYQKNVSMMITLPKHYRNLLRTLVAEANLKDQDRVLTASQLVREIVCQYLDKELQNSAKSGEDVRI